MPDAHQTLYCIPHTHWEGAVFKTREQYLDMGLPHILKALKLLKAHPAYRFTLDQVCYVRPFIERYPEEAETFRRFVSEGRLTIAGGTDVMPDVNMPSGESFVRQILYGKGYLRRELGLDVTTGWQLDTFGHHAQMPQLLKLAGFESFWFFRGVANWQVPGEFLWEGIDGSRIPAFWLAQGYCFLYGSPKTLPEFTAFMKERYDQLGPQARGQCRVGIAAGDVGDAEEHLPVLAEAFNRQPDRPFLLQLAGPADYEAAAAKRTDRPVIRGELNPIFQGTYSSRIELKQRTRELERLLTTAEKLGALLAGLGIATDAAPTWRAWEPMLFNHAHDLMSGVMTDHVYEDTVRGYEYSRRLAEEQVEGRIRALILRIDTPGEGIPLVVFNALGWARTDAVTATVAFSDGGVRGVAVIGPDGETIPCQIIEARRSDGGALMQARIAFVARDVPAMGYAVYRVRPQATEAAAEESDARGTAVLENEFLRVEIDAATGAITGLKVKDGNWSALRAPGTVVAMEEDGGDLWELYRTLDGGSRIAMQERHEPPAPGKATLSTDQAAERGHVTRGPVVSEFTVAHPFSLEGRFLTTIRLYAGLPRIEIRTHILNQDSDVRYRVLFPTSIATGESVHEIPFGAIRRPDGIEFPAQNWVDWSDGAKGVVLLNRGLSGNNTADGTMMLSLLRSARIGGYGYQGGYEPGMGSDSGLEMGKELTFDYALLPHAGDWRRATPWRAGMEFNQPLMSRTADVHAGDLPTRWGFCEVSHPNVVVSALKCGENGGIVLRVYEASGAAAGDVTLELSAAITRVTEVNLMEDPIADASVEQGALRFDLRPFEIKSFSVTGMAESPES